jgi:hypothetical protein
MARITNFNPHYVDNTPKGLEYIEKFFPTCVPKWEIASSESQRGGTEYIFRVEWPHLSAEDKSCWHDMHKITCQCKTWSHGEWKPWLTDEAKAGLVP